MKRYIKYILFALMIVLCTCAFGACAKEPQKKEENTEREVQLSTPTNFSVKGEELSWDEVENADYYLLQCNGEEKNLITNSYTLNVNLQVREVVVRVRAVSFNKLYLKSDWAEYTFDNVYFQEETPTAALKYTLLEDKSGYEVARAYKDPNQGLAGRVVIPNFYNGLPVKKIAEDAFCYDELNINGGQANKNTVTTSFRLPEYLEEIGQAAFLDCVALEEIELPQGLKTIGSAAFGGCYKIKSVNIPNGITEIATAVFRDCITLRSITIPNGVNSIAHLAFARCTALEEIRLPENLAKIDLKVFTDCVNLKEIVIPETVTEISTSAFSGCTSLKKIVIPESVTSIGKLAFSNCTNLADITLPQNIQNFSSGTFDGTAWYEAQPNGLVTIRGDILYGYKGEMAEGTVIDEWPSEVKYFASEAFYKSNGLKSVTLPQQGIKFLGGGTFNRCTSLTEVIIADDIKEIPDQMFYFCKALTSVMLPEGLEYICDYAFSNCSALTEISLPSTVKEIGERAFESCSKLTSIIIPQGVKAISKEVFWGCKQLTSVTIPEGVTVVGDRAFNSCENLKEVILPSTLKEIGVAAFASCKQLTSIIIPEGVKTIDSQTFSNSGLESIVIPSSVEEITNKALNCQNLSALYYAGTAKQWAAITLGGNEEYIKNATIYFYSETKPVTEGNYWHYVNGEPVVWTKE